MRLKGSCYLERKCYVSYLILWCDDPLPSNDGKNIVPLWKIWLHRECVKIELGRMLQTRMLQTFAAASSSRYLLRKAAATPFSRWRLYEVPAKLKKHRDDPERAVDRAKPPTTSKTDSVPHSNIAVLPIPTRPPYLHPAALAALTADLAARKPFKPCGIDCHEVRGEA